MELNALTAISPLDGRYRTKTEPLVPYFSEYGLMRYRIQVEIEYFIALCNLDIEQLRHFPKQEFPTLRAVYANFTPDNAEVIKKIELITNHDVKAVEYFLREMWDALEIGKYKEFIHFGLTSQDINNTAIPYALKNSMEEVILPAMERLLAEINGLGEDAKGIPMLSRTHGQPASPTRLGKEIQVFTERLSKQLSSLMNASYYGKFGGATGNFNAHVAAYPEIDWVAFSNVFLQDAFGLNRNQYTTQIDHYDDMAAIFDNIRRISVILIDFCRDIWSYISMDYFKLRMKEGEIGSSAMPHKVNPIDFENAEGNLSFANAILDYMSNKLPVSRLQRDLTDSTVLRNIGVPLSHIYLAIDSILKGIDKLEINRPKIEKDLSENWNIISEGIQTILRREGFEHPYDLLKQFSRGRNHLGKEEFAEFINQLEVSDAVKAELGKLTPWNYLGV
jgi:adenylosuccinate lyase